MLKYWRLLVITYIVFTATTIRGQDTLQISNGDILLVKIIDISSDGVKYKLWHNMDGPTWSRTFDNIKSIKKFQSSQIERKTQKQKDIIFSVKSAITAIEQIFYSAQITNLSDGSMQAIKESISSYYKGLPPNIDKKKIISHFYNAILEASEQESNNSGLLRNGIIYLSLVADEDIEIAYKAIAIYYANLYDKDNLSYIISDFQTYSKTHGDKYSETIAQMYHEYDEVLNQRPFAEQVKGVWAMVNKTNWMNYPYSILEIRNLNQNNGGIYMVNFPGKDDANNDEDMYKLKYSQQIGGHDGYITTTFASDHLNIGDDSFANSGFESTRRLRADMRGEIAAAKTSFGNKVAATAATEVVTSLLDGLFSTTAQSYKRTGAMNLQLNYFSSNLFQGSMQYWDYELNVNQMNNNVPPPNYQGLAEYVRWEPDDSIYFVNCKNKIFSVSQSSQLDLTEYDKIKKKYSWTHPKYLLPLIGVELLGASAVYYGVTQIADCRVKDSNGNEIKESDGSYMVDNNKLTTGLIFSISGYVAMLVPPIVIPNIRMSKRRAAYNELNRQNMQKLQKKKNKAVSTLSVSPLIDSNNNYGIYAGLTF